MIKADDLVTYEEEDGKVKANSFTNFELLQKEVEVLKDTINVLTGILRDNGMNRKDLDLNAPYFNDEEVLTRLGAETTE